MKFLTTLISLLLAPSITFSAPSKPSVSGTFSHGQTVTISGSSFGTKSPAKPYLWAPFDGSLNPSSLGTITAWDEINNFTYVSNEGAGGTGGAKGGSTRNQWGDAVWTMLVESSGFAWNDANQQMFLFRKTKRNFDIGTTNFKVFRFWGAGFEYPDIYINYGNSHVVTVENIGSGRWYDSYDSGVDFEADLHGPKDQYNTDEILMKANSANSASDGKFVHFVNGVKRMEFNDLSIKNSTYPTAMTIAIPVHGVTANVDFPTSNLYWADDIYLDRTWSRVMIGNASTWAASTHKEPLIPSEWSTSSITATVNTGTFATNDTVYLYVVDANGDASPASDPITVGGCGGGDTTAPSTTISTSDPSSISSDSLTVTGSASDAVGVSGCKWRIGSAPTSSVGTACTGTTSFSCSTSGYSSGANSLYVGCYDAAGNYGSDSIVVNYTPSGGAVSIGTVLLGR